MIISDLSRKLSVLGGEQREVRKLRTLCAWRVVIKDVNEGIVIICVLITVVFIQTQQKLSLLEKAHLTCSKEASSILTQFQVKLFTKEEKNITCTEGKTA